MVELLPCLSIHGQPVGRYLAVQILVADYGVFQLGAEGFGAAIRHEMLNGLVDEPGALTKPDHAVNGPDGWLAGGRC